MSQQQVDYIIDVEVNVDRKYLSASANVTYHNHSRNTLPYLIFELPQQRFQQADDIKSAGTTFLKAQNQLGQTLHVEQKQTYYLVHLDKPLKANQKQKITLTWDLQFIERNNDLSPRSGFEITKSGAILIGAAQWYPRALGFDEQFQWDTLPFKGKGEFHLELGNFIVNINVPANYMVAATGELTNPNRVLTPKQLELFSSQNTETITIPNEHLSANDTNTWQFTSELSRDFAFALGDQLVWERKSIQLSTGIHHINIFYPDNGRWLWQKYGMDGAVHAISYLDANVASFPFKNYTVFNIAGISMEHPGFTFVGFRGPDHKGSGKPNYSRTQKHDVLGGTFHEIAHSYFPMYVNTNERREGYFDEGITSYLAYLIEQSWSEDFQSFYGSPLDIVPVMLHSYQPPFTLADNLKSKLSSHYHLPATAWHILGEQILAPHQLLTLLNKFILKWQGRRAYFTDLMTFLDNNTDQALAPFFNFWFNSGLHVDLAISEVKQDKLTAMITVSNLGGIPMPATMKVVYKSGEITTHQISFQDWQAPYLQINIELAHPSSIKRIVLDPNNKSADINTSNNHWPLIGG
ncbi:hypothetical protein RT723_09590 [Psychrosphaera aquimarina]|uniref:Peptidase M1 membrane alanine aminopeptidase domain-containing protein n=1 Tax=Psychrosphaera aquimarina TaxID=2044854 RepID=A0ABU3R0M9_9GAMM|nr:hypothetical protein [Psychrosphaera aquimarina]MDU0113242.1 hypothetical protein [Psychrosphaera aquimarina]